MFNQFIFPFNFMFKRNFVAQNYEPTSDESLILKETIIISNFIRFLFSLIHFSRPLCFLLKCAMQNLGLAINERFTRVKTGGACSMLAHKVRLSTPALCVKICVSRCKVYTTQSCTQWYIIKLSKRRLSYYYFLFFVLILYNQNVFVLYVVKYITSVCRL